MRRWRWRSKRAALALAALVVGMGAVLALAWDRLAGAGEVRGLTGWISPVPRDRLREIARQGRARGSLPGVFSRVGDSLSADSRFLTPFTQEDRYRLGSYGALRAAIDTWSQPNGRGEPSFGAASRAVAVGWTSADVLAPGLNGTGACGADETPLACEYRTARPSVALIMLGTNDVAAGRPAASYRANLAAILDASLAWGVIPVLSTIPPQPAIAAHDARVREFNAIVRDLAAGYRIPLWDFWAALQPLPDAGLSADGVHLSAPPDGQTAVFDAGHLAYGVTARNLGALDALDMVRRALD